MGDVGANIEPKPHHLAQYGVMGSIYASKILGIDNPRVGLMNVGGEEAKGTAELRLARDQLKSAEKTNFIGFVEGRGVFDGEADVVVTDGKWILRKIDTKHKTRIAEDNRNRQ